MNNAINQVAATFISRISAIDTQLKARASMVVSFGYIIRVGDVTVSIDTDKQGNVIKAYPMQPEQCTCMTKSAAERLAAKTTNGNGEVGHAIHVVDALKEERNKIVEQLEMIARPIPPCAFMMANAFNNLHA